MKRVLTSLLAIVLCFSFYGCKQKPKDISFDPIQMENICELAALECYYHNVAKFTEKNRETFLWIKKDVHFWIEYTSIVKYGIDASELKIDVKGNNVTVYLPDAKFFGASDIVLDDGAYIIDKNSAKITAEDEIKAIAQAQADLERRAANNTMLLDMAKAHVKELLSDYITNIGDAFGKNYTIVWVDSNTDSTEAKSVSSDISAQ